MLQLWIFYGKTKSKLQFGMKLEWISVTPLLRNFFSKELNQVTKQRKILKEVLIFSQRVFLILNDFSDFSTHHQIYSPLTPLLAVEDTTSRTENNRRIFLIFLNFISFWQLYNIFPYNYFSWCGLARSKVRASPSAPAFIERVNKAIVEQASPAYLDQSMITLRKINN